MLSTSILIAYAIILVACSMVLPVWFLHFGTKWVGAAAPSIWKALGASLLGELNSGVLAAIVWALPLDKKIWTVVFVTIGQAVLSLVIRCGAIGLIYRINLWRAFKAWLLTLIPVGGLLALLFLVVRPFVTQAYAIPTNSMAPTILGQHWQGTCPRCGQPAYCSPQEYHGIRDVETLMICSRELRSCKVLNPNPKVFSGDRVLVAKYLRPRRWDLMVFRLPDDPSVNYVKRLVGLPGETVIITAGAVWIDGRQLIPPDSIRGIEYMDQLEGIEDSRIWGTTQQPAQLGDDEYFVLGDFSAQAKDSRLWEQGAPGHPPYAVPESYLIGVVTHTYWPPQRWRMFR